MDAGRRAGGKTHAGTRGRRVAIVGPCSLKRNDKEGSFGRRKGRKRRDRRGEGIVLPSPQTDGAAASNVAAANAAATITMPYDARFFEEEEEKREREGKKKEGRTRTHVSVCVMCVRVCECE